MENKKVRGTKVISYNNIKFKSTLECNCYKLLEKSELDFTHEDEKFVLWDGFKMDNVLVYSTNKKTKQLTLQTRPLLPITYTPDFCIKYKNYNIYIDSKGFSNDTYPIKKKMFIKHISTLDGNIGMFFEPHNLKQMAEVINIIKSL